MSSTPVFKTIHECRVELVAHTVTGDIYGETWPESARFLPVSAARASFGNEDKTGDDPKADLKLMKFLADNQHWTPFEYNHATFLVECPLFVLSQIKTHRSLKGYDLATNVISRRYTSEDIAFWVPDKAPKSGAGAANPLLWRKQSPNNKQASTDEAVTYVGYPEMMEELVGMYEGMLEAGVCREEARAVLPESLLTRMFLGGTLRTWAHFLTLRTDPHAQYEIQVVARRIEEQLRELWPEAMSCLMGEGRERS